MSRQLFPADPYPRPHTHTHTCTHVFAFVMLICLICIIALPIPRTTIIIITIVFFVYADKKFHSQFELLLLLLLCWGERDALPLCVCGSVSVCLGILFGTWVDCWICVTWICLPFTPAALYLPVCECVCLSNMQNVVINITENAEN